MASNNPNDPYQPDINNTPKADLSGQTNQPGYGDVQGYYKKYLGRDANPDDPTKWLSGAYGYGTDLPTIENAIKNSDEAKQYAAKQGGAQPPAGGIPSDYDLAQAMMQRLNAPGQTMSYQDMVNEFNKGYGTDYQAYNDSRGQTVGFHTGYLSKEPNGWAWTARGPEGASAPPPAPGTNVNGMLQGSADNGWSAFLKAQQDEIAKNNAMRDQFRQAILGQLDTLQNDKTATDPNGAQLSPILNAYHLQSQRGLQDTRNMLAEQAYATGTANTGGYSSREQQAVERAGASEAGFTGGQVADAVKTRQQMLQHLLDTGSGFLSQGESEGAQATMADLAAQLQRAQLQQQQGQFGDTLGFNYTQLQAMMNQQALLQALAGRG